MKRLHKSCFVGTDAIDWLCKHAGSTPTSREDARAIGRKMMTAGLFRHVTDSHKFKDSHLYYRFQEVCARVN